MLAPLPGLWGSMAGLPPPPPGSASGSCYFRLEDDIGGKHAGLRGFRALSMCKLWKMAILV